MKVEESGRDYQGLAEDSMEVVQEDLYQVCGVTKEATATELKKSYRKVRMRVPCRDVAFALSSHLRLSPSART
jgi:hypothetical protein